MPQPFLTPDYSNEKTPENYRAILLALRDYKIRLIQQITTQHPSQLQRPQNLFIVRQKLVSDASELNEFLTTREIPTHVSLDLQYLMQEIKDQITAWNFRNTALIGEWIDIMFIQFPFTPSQHHIENLLKLINNEPIEQNGQPDEEEQTSPEE